jgi:acyl dehydratase
MTLDAFLRLGVVVDLGAYKFEPEAIKAFARKYDPQPFHVDE